MIKITVQHQNQTRDDIPKLQDLLFTIQNLQKKSKRKLFFRLKVKLQP